MDELQRQCCAMLFMIFQLRPDQQFNLFELSLDGGVPFAVFQLPAGSKFKLFELSLVGV
jgi:hypothetical protein